MQQMQLNGQQQGQQGQPMQQGQQMQQMQSMQQMQPMQQQGGSYDNIVSPVPGGAAIIAVDTSEQAMQNDGIDTGGRLVRRRFQGQSQGQMGGQMGQNQGFNPPSHGSNSIGMLTITKLE